MSAQRQDPARANDSVPRLGTLAHDALDDVVALERTVYPFPWTRGNFVDSIVAGYLCWRLDWPGGLVGYCIAMRGAGELHVLNLTVAEAQRRCGHARRFLDALARLGRDEGAKRIWLEVRDGNTVARDAYARIGFATVGIRRGYYPAPASSREDAVVMSLDIGEGRTRDALD